MSSRPGEKEGEGEKRKDEHPRTVAQAIKVSRHRFRGLRRLLGLTLLIWVHSAKITVGQKQFRLKAKKCFFTLLSILFILGSGNNYDFNSPP